jgi:hypothetical protein
MSESLYRPPAGDPALSVYLIRINDRPFGFRVVAVVSSTEQDALDYCAKSYAAQFDVTKPNFARIEHRCTVLDGVAATFTWEE